MSARNIVGMLVFIIGSLISAYVLALPFIFPVIFNVGEEILGCVLGSLVIMFFNLLFTMQVID